MLDQSTSEETLVRSVRKQNTEALALFLSRNRDVLLHMIEVHLKPPIAIRVDPNDVLQDLYVYAVARIGSFEGDSPPMLMNWLQMLLLQVLSNLRRKHYRQKRDVNREASVDVWPNSDTSSVAVGNALVSDGLSPSEAAVNGETGQIIKRAIADLDEADRQVLLLRHFHNRSTAETAEALGIQPKAASKRYRRALRRLKEAIVQSSPDIKMD